LVRGRIFQGETGTTRVSMKTMFMLMLMFMFMFMFMFMLMFMFSPYVHIIKVLSTTAGYGISRDQGKILYGVERSFGDTGLPEFSTSTQKEEKGGWRERIA
jgi:hypothetical protein